MKPIFLVNGPNLNLLGEREPHIYGARTLADIEAAAADRAREHGLTLRAFQSNHEGELITIVQQARREASAMVVNPGGYGHTSVALADAVAACEGVFVVEVHLSALARREPFRHFSYLSAVVDGVITGLGGDGYLLAVDAVARRVAATEGTSP